MSEINGISILAKALDGSLQKLGDLNGTVSVKFTGENLAMGYQSASDNINLTDGWVIGGTGYWQNPVYLGDATNTLPNYIPNSGQTVWPMHTIYIAPTMPVAPAVTPAEIIQLAEFYKKLAKEGHIVIDDETLKQAAAEELKHEPTQEEMDEIRRQIYDRIISPEEREL